MGRRLQGLGNGVAEPSQYNAANMLLQRGANAYQNDGNGNTLSGGGRSMAWDSQNRMVSCSFQGTNSSFTYGADGLRRRMVAGTTTTDYVIDGQMAVRTLNGSNV